MTFTFRPGKRENVPLLIGVAGGTGSGKTMSALRLARGLAGGEPFAIIDTENGRANYYADLFPEMRHGDLSAPFRPMRYAEAIEAADAEHFPVVVVDSASHEWAGDGGCLDWHDEIMGGDQKRTAMAWIEPKREHKRMVTRLLQVKAHIILCFRAEPKVDIIREGGETKIIPSQAITGLDGWVPISEKMMPYELTASFLLMAGDENAGIPRPIKLPEQLRPFVPLDQQLSEETGKRLAEWALGPSAASKPARGAGGGMTRAQFKAKMKASRIAREKITTVGGEMFPGKSVDSLTDKQRLAFWTKLTEPDAEEAAVAELTQAAFPVPTSARREE